MSRISTPDFLPGCIGWVSQQGRRAISGSLVAKQSDTCVTYRFQLLSDSCVALFLDNQTHLKIPFGRSGDTKNGNEIQINRRKLFSALPTQMVKECFLTSEFAISVVPAT